MMICVRVLAGGCCTNEIEIEKRLACFNSKKNAKYEKVPKNHTREKNGSKKGRPMVLVFLRARQLARPLDIEVSGAKSLKLF